jgi:diguanylate cyclase (GGDEF)-like protein
MISGNSSELSGPAPRAGDAARTAWVLRTAGLFLVVAGWAVVSLIDLGASSMALNGAVFGALAGYALIAAAMSRRISVNEEKQLRMELLVHNMELEKLATRDELTELYNRQYFFDRLHREMETARGFDRPLSVLVLDIDGLRSINGEHGHAIGDQLLTSFGICLLGQTRASDVPARIGGDKFAVILPDTTESQAAVMVNRLHQALEGKPLLDDGQRRLHLAVSLGVAGFPWSGRDVDTIMHRAELSAASNKRARRQPAAIALGGAPEDKAQ